MAALGLEFLGPHGTGWMAAVRASCRPIGQDCADVGAKRATFKPEEANRQFDYAIASRGCP